MQDSSEKFDLLTKESAIVDQDSLALALINSQEAGLFLVDENLQVLFWNNWMERWAGIAGDKISGQQLTGMFTSLIASEFSRTIEKVLTKQQKVTWLQSQDPEMVDHLEQALSGGSSAMPLSQVAFIPFQQPGISTACLVQLVLGPYEASVAAKPASGKPTAREKSLQVDLPTEAVVEVDTDGLITSASLLLQELFCYSEKQLIGKPIRLLFPELRLPFTKSALEPSEHITEGVNALGDDLYLSIIDFPVTGSSGTALVCRELSQSRLKEESFSHQRDVLSSIFQHTADGIMLVGRDGYVDSINPVGREILGIAEAFEANMHVDDVMVLEDSKGVPCLSPVTEAITRGSTIEVMSDIYLRVSGRNAEPIAITATPLRNPLNKITGCVAVFRSISEARRISNRLSWQSSHDALTLLPNRRFLERELLQAIDDAHIHPEAHHTLLYIDLYNFSVINDTSGHNAGDELLRQFARILECHFDANDVVARIGNDEFAVLIRNKPVEKARELADQLLEEAKNFSFPWDEKRLKIGLSIGAKVIDQDVTSEIDVLVAAGTSCAAAKESGRNRVNFQYRSKDIAYRKHVAEWIPRISEALEENRFELYCQPIVPLGRNQDGVKHYELLARMRDPQGRIVLPGKFIPSAEHFGLIEDIDKWVLNTIFNYQKKRLDEGLPLARYAINLSGKSIGDENLRRHIMENFSRTGIDPHYFQFEITETAAIRNFDRAIDLIHSLKAEGCYFSLDDFGSGLSSLGYLKELPVDYLKIDGSFIKNLEVQDINYSMVSTINHLGHIMGISTVAESVENTAQLAILEEIGIDYCQGYLIARPQPIGSFDDN